MVDIPSWEDAETIKAAHYTAAIVTKLTSHLGWSSVMASQAIRTAVHHPKRAGSKFERLTTDHLSFQPMVDENGQLIHPSGPQSQPRDVSRLRLPPDRDTLNLYPTIGIAALKQKRAAFYRVCCCAGTWMKRDRAGSEARGYLSSKIIGVSKEERLLPQSLRLGTNDIYHLTAKYPLWHNP